MQFSESSNLQKKAERENSPAASSLFLACGIWATRIIIGIVFIFSGWVKAVDPWGTIFKINDYAAALHLSLLQEVMVVTAFMLCAAEFCLGVMVLSGIMRRTSAWCLLMFMAVMTPLTGWIYFASPVTDCGCFGDALVISNGATFLKNIVLTAGALFLIFRNRRVRGIILPSVQWIAVFCSMLYPMLLSLYGYAVQPLVDFRPYAVGNTLVADDSMENPKFIYSKDGKEHSFTADNLPEGEEWIFVRREDPPQTGAHKKQLAFIDEYGDDVTPDVIEESSTPGGLLLLCVPEPEAHGISRSQMANSLNRYQHMHNGAMAAVVATDSIGRWVKEVNAEYPVYFSDDTDLKTLARGNASLVYVVNDTIQWKYSLYSIDPELVNSPADKTSDILSGMTPAESSIVLPLTSGIYLMIIGTLILLSLTAIMHKSKNNLSISVAAADKGQS